MKVLGNSFRVKWPLSERSKGHLEEARKQIKSTEGLKQMNGHVTTGACILRRPANIHARCFACQDLGALVGLVAAFLESNGIPWRMAETRPLTEGLLTPLVISTRHYSFGSLSLKSSPTITFSGGCKKQTARNYMGIDLQTHNPEVVFETRSPQASPRKVAASAKGQRSRTWKRWLFGFGFWWI